jgi:hypothetical protein
MLVCIYEGLILDLETVECVFEVQMEIVKHLKRIGFHQVHLS